MKENEVKPFELFNSSHAVLFYEDDVEKYQRILPFLKEGLDNGEAVIYISDIGDERYKTEFEDFGINLKHKGLQIFNVEEWYLDHGNLIPETIIDKWDGIRRWANKSGFKKIRATSETSYFFKNDMVNQFMNYEAGLPKRFKSSMTMICQYRTGDISSYNEGWLLQELLRIHGCIITPDLVQEIDFPTFFMNSVSETLDSILGAEARQTLLYHVEGICAMPRSEIIMRPLEFERTLEYILGSGGKPITHAILMHMYSKIGLK